MDPRSWLWKRKSPEKSPGETESSGSVSSHSERYSDDQVSLWPTLIIFTACHLKCTYLFCYQNYAALDS